MKLELIGHDHRHAVEQMALMLLGDLDAAPGQLSVTLSDPAAASARYLTDGTEYTATVEASQLGLDGQVDPKALEQRLVKLAAYRAVTQVTGKPAWGALSGVRPAKLAAKWLRAGATDGQCLDLLTGVYELDAGKARLTLACAQESLAVEETLEPRDLSLYIGIPFCPTRCAYCSFISADVKGALALVKPYVSALEREIAWAGDYLGRKGLRVRSVYMGGGTPTTLSAEALDRLLTALDRWLDRSALEEFTIEAGRPDTIDPEKLEVLRRHGVDRVSVNPQTLSDTVLQAMGRAHTAQQFRDAYALARSAGFPAVNTDLIAGLPQDTVEGFARTLDEILSLAPEEVTLHTLARKKGSRYSEEIQTNVPRETISKNGGLENQTIVPRETFPDGEQVAQMLAYAAQSLPQAGYRPYYLYRQKYMTGALENVGWTRRPKASFYNIVMMEELHSVLALGAGGMTKVVDRQSGTILRRQNPKYPKEYLERLSDSIQEREALPWPIN